jgi:hypothetical protein
MNGLDVTSPQEILGKKSVGLQLELDACTAGCKRRWTTILLYLATIRS